MYFGLKLASITTLGVFIASGCSVSQKLSSKNTSPNVDELSAITRKFVYRNWRIDSVAENGVITNREDHSDGYQGFIFKTTGGVMMFEKTKYEIARPICNYRIENDSIFFISQEKGIVFQRYRYEISDSTLILYGNFSISALNNAKPTFYTTWVK